MQNFSPESHKSCMVCGDPRFNPQSLGLSFHALNQHQLSAELALGEQYQGYQGMLHGGMISTLLDAAMVHQLFRMGIQAYTAELKVRFVRPIALGSMMSLSAELLSERRGVYCLAGKIEVAGELAAKAQAKFICAAS
ncbi:PaaI family thioesterase [Agarivorans gilvus]|jgi:uncharacterized protein (TIGR00369 family)|uniref:Thioesterase n=1 Tax=Agarivorans gilvus TaxID=680279 RepID=A0ABQ1I247_9ALTE|nr:PaaI family thioesterase [Agarivorans gilvus]GGB06063.1 thioesterase [Agarivorans gilvus]